MRNILGEKLEKFLQKQIVDIPEFSGIEVETVGDLEKLVKKLLKVCNSNVEGTYNFDPADLEGDNAGDSYIPDCLECIADTVEKNLTRGHCVKVTVEVFKRIGRPKE